MNLDGEFVISESHPALPGHFPGNPVVPGAVVLDRAVAALGRESGLQVRVMRRVKFSGQLPVNVACRVTANRRDDGMVVMTCVAEGSIVLSAILECDVKPCAE